MLSVIRRYYIETAERTELGFGTEKFLRLTLHCVVIEFEYLRKLRYFPLKHQFKLLTLPIFLPFRHDSRQPYESCKPIVRLMKIRHTHCPPCLQHVCGSSATAETCCFPTLLVVQIDQSVRVCTSVSGQ